MSCGTPEISPTSSISSDTSPRSTPAQESRVPVYDAEEKQGLYSNEPRVKDLAISPLNFGVELEFNAKLKEKGLELFYQLQTDQEDEDSGAVSDSGSSARTVTARSSTCDLEWEDIAEVIKAVLERCCLLKAKISCLRDPDECYDRWIVSKEFSIEIEDSDYFGIELVTPVLSTNRDWKYLLRMVLDTLNEYLELLFSRDCGAHIHLSPLHGRWTLPAAKNIAKAVIYFDPIIETLLPPERRKNFWCFSNTSAPQVNVDLQVLEQMIALDGSEKEKDDNHSTATKPRPDFKQTFTHISTFPTLASLINYISPDKCHSWNFRHLSPDAKCGTVEFRRPRMVQDSMVLISTIPSDKMGCH
ncbi:hypothetical protein BDQ17DRAFT_1407659 [Cyathus striatus]|nr:hypothetical protein BDQ17DRAFT_1407659 [Cyathus striatus]